MKNLLAILFSLCVSVSAFAEDTNWQITEVPNKDNVIVGYIYHSGAVGTQVDTNKKSQKVVTSLRLVCSLKASTQRDNDSLFVLYWDTMEGVSGQYIVSKTSGEPTDHNMFRWEQDGPLLIRSMNESRDIIQKMKLSKNMSFMWHSKDGTLRTTMFDLRTFGSHLTEFGTLCKIDL